MCDVEFADRITYLLTYLFSDSSHLQATPTHVRKRCGSKSLLSPAVVYDKIINIPV